MKQIFTVILATLFFIVSALPANAENDYIDPSDHADVVDVMFGDGVPPATTEFNTIGAWIDSVISAGTAGNGFGDDVATGGDVFVEDDTNIVAGGCGDCGTLETTFNGRINAGHQTVALTESEHEGASGTAAVIAGDLDFSAILARGGNVDEFDGDYGGDVEPAFDEYSVLGARAEFDAGGTSNGYGLGDQVATVGITDVGVDATVRGSSCGGCASIETVMNGSILTQQQTIAASQGEGSAEAFTYATTTGDLDFNATIVRGGNVEEEDTPVDHDPDY